MIIDALQCKFPPQDPTTREMAKTRLLLKSVLGRDCSGGSHRKVFMGARGTIEAGI
jgi:hypothetical protein